MNKDEITYAIIGVLLGAVIGFFSANMSAPGPTAVPPVTSDSSSGSRTVNTGSEELPPGHPPINPGETVPAPPLAGDGETPGRTTPSGETIELPSLDPLPASSREERTEQKYKNIQVLKGLPASRLEPIMFAFKNSLGVDCTYCHVKDQFEKDDKPAKQMGRKMIGLTRDWNAKLGGSTRVTCNTCHRGQPRPPE
ncbi:MAG TPA: photosynthetic reaction center cytochrome c subunit family protein [Blastocatellia bacterium]|nr:photosynthetic reaction center cytochrome c subunit family protein [Blastocatellia bacterium]